MQLCLAEFTGQLVLSKNRDIFDGGVSFAKFRRVGIEVLMVNQLDELLIHRSFKFTDTQAVPALADLCALPVIA